mgnify:CR=1 FL=1
MLQGYPAIGLHVTYVRAHLVCDREQESLQSRLCFWHVPVHKSSEALMHLPAMTEEGLHLME